MSHQQIIINKQLVSYFNVENAGQKCLLFLHGWRSSKDVWQGLIKNLGLRLKDANFIAVDLPGFGQSQLPKAPMTVGDYAEVTAEFIKKLDLKNVVIVGHSFGGRVGIKLASQNPELVSKLVLIDSAGFAMGDGKKSIINTAAKIAKPFFKPKFMQGLRKKVYQQIGAEDYVATPELKETFVNIVSEDLTAGMKKITCPTLILRGEKDTDTPLEFGQRMSSLIVNSKFQILRNAGHFSFLDQTDECARLVANFTS